MKIERGSWDDVVGRVCCGDLNVGIATTHSTELIGIYWTESGYDDIIQRAYPKGKIEPHGDYRSMIVVEMEIGDVFQKIIQAVDRVIPSVT